MQELPELHKVRLDKPDHLAALKDLSLDYFLWLESEFSRELALSLSQQIGMSLPEYVDQTLQQFLPKAASDGVFYLVKQGDYVAMAGLRRLTANAAEVKRLFVKPEARAQGLAGLLLQKLKQEAGNLNYATLFLDSAPFMRAAHQLYYKQGFYHCAAYAGTEVPAQLQANWHFMRCDLI